MQVRHPSDSNVSNLANGLLANSPADDYVEQQNADAQDALQAALDAHRTLKTAEKAADQARATYNAACAKLAPFQRLSRVA